MPHPRRPGPLLVLSLLALAACADAHPARPPAPASAPADPTLLVSYLGRWDGARLTLARLNPDGTAQAAQADTLGTIPSSTSGSDVTVTPPSDTVVLQQTEARGLDAACLAGTYVEPASPPSAVPSPFQGVCFNIAMLSGFASRELVRAYVQLTLLTNTHDSGAIATYNDSPDDSEYGLTAAPGLWLYGRLAAPGTSGVRVAGGATVPLDRVARNWFFATPEPGASAAFAFRADVRGLVVQPATRAAPASGGAECTPLGRPALSADGQYAAFVTTSSACRGATGGALQVVRREIATGATVLVSHAAGSSASGSNGLNTEVSISRDGREVAWESTATDLLPGGADAIGDTDSNGALSDVFVRDLSDDAVYLGDVDYTTLATGPLASHHPLLTESGAGVVFETANNLDALGGDGNALVDVYTGDVFDGIAWLDSPDAPGRTRDATRGAPDADATVVAFQSDDPAFAPGDTNGATDVFVVDLAYGTTVRVSDPSGGGAADGPASLAAMGEGGAWVAFQSSATNLSPPNAVGAISGTHVYARALDGSGGLVAGSLRLADVSPAGAPGNGAATLASLGQSGRYLGFVSAANNLDPLDAGTGLDGYLFDLYSLDPRRACAHLLSASAANAPSNAVGAAGVFVDPHGEYAALLTATALAGGSPPPGSSVYRVPLR